MTLSQFGVLEALYHKGPLTQREIAEAIRRLLGVLTPEELSLLGALSRKLGHELKGGETSPTSAGGAV